MQEKVKESEEEFIKWYHRFRNDCDNDNVNWNLAMSVSEDLRKLIEKIELSFKIIDERIKSQKTYCVVFDAKCNDQDTVLNSLVKENISEKLSPKEEYYVKEEENFSCTKILRRSSDVYNEISKIIVPSLNWSLPMGSRLTLSHQNYSQFMKECQDRKYFIDTVIVTLNSLNCFNDQDIKLLLYEINEKQYNAVLLLNDAPTNECTFWRDCDICYEDKPEFLRTYPLLTEDRFLKISTKPAEENIISKMPMDENFRQFLKVLKDDLTMENIVVRHLKNASTFMECFDQLKKTVFLVRTKVENETLNYEKIFDEKKLETEFIIEKSCETTENQLEDKIRNAGNNQNLNKDFVKNNVDPLIDETFKQFRNTFKKKIVGAIKQGNEKFEEYIGTMYFDEYMNPGDYEQGLKRRINICVQEVDEEQKIRKGTKEERIESFLSKTKQHISNTFVTIKCSFADFVHQFKGKILNRYDTFETSIKTNSESFTQCVKHNLVDDTKDMIMLMEKRMANTRVLIDTSINCVCDTLIGEIDKRKEVNIYPTIITDHLPSVVDICSTLSLSIKGHLLTLKDEIVSLIKHTGTNPLMKLWTDDMDKFLGLKYWQQIMDKKMKDSVVSYVTKLHSDLQQKDLHIGNLDDLDKYDVTWYKRMADSGLVLAGVLKKVALGNLPSRKVITVVKSKVNLRRRSISVEYEFVFIKAKPMIRLVRLAETNMQTETALIMALIEKDLCNFLHDRCLKAQYNQ